MYLTTYTLRQTACSLLNEIVLITLNEKNKLDYLPYPVDRCV